MSAMADVSLSLPSSLSQQTLGDKESANTPHISVLWYLSNHAAKIHNFLKIHKKNRIFNNSTL